MSLIREGLASRVRALSCQEETLVEVGREWRRAAWHGKPPEWFAWSAKELRQGLRMTAKPDTFEFDTYGPSVWSGSTVRLVF